MPKLCQCRKKQVLDYIYSIKRPLANELVVAKLIQEIESDCVCSKEEVKRTPSDKCLHGYLLTEPCKHCMWDEKYGVEEKQSQFPCEPLPDRAELSQCKHECPELMEIYGRVTLYLCPKCGLVTCLNPNQE